MRKFFSTRSFFLQGAFGLLLLFAISNVLPADQTVVGDVVEDGNPVPAKLKFAAWNIKKLGYVRDTERAVNELKIIANVLSKYHFIVITELMHVKDLEQVLGVEDPVIIKWKGDKLMKLKASKFDKLKSEETLDFNDFKDDDFQEGKVVLENAKDSRWDFAQILEILSNKKRKYSCLISPKVGTKSPERYAFLYDEQVVSHLKGEGLYPDAIGDEGDFVRDPYWATFRAGKFDFSVIAVHIRYKNGNAAEILKKRRKEIMALHKVYNFVQTKNRGENDVLLVGDFNLDPCDKLAFRNLMSLGKMEALFDWVLHRSNTRKTQLYDNIFFDKDYVTEFEDLDRDVDKFEESIWDFFKCDYKKLDKISDHRPIYANFRIDEDDDEDDGDDGRYEIKDFEPGNLADIKDPVFYMPHTHKYHTNDCGHDIKNGILISLKELHKGCYKPCRVIKRREKEKD